MTISLGDFIRALVTGQQVRTVEINGKVVRQIRMTCPTCDGEKKINGKKCKGCGGEGCLWLEMVP
jgi:DnaJ-class molecular chaperone